MTRKLKNAGWLALGGLLTLALAVALAFAWTAWRAYLSPPMREALRWLPEDTECVAWVEEPIALPLSTSVEQTEGFLSILPFAPFAHTQELDLFDLGAGTVHRAIAGMRRFGIDQMGDLQIFEGASVFLFDAGNAASADSLFRDLSRRAHSSSESAGYPMIEISGESQERRLWVVRPRDTVIVLATNEGYLRELLLRMKAPVARSPMAVVAREGLGRSEGLRKWAYRVFDRQAGASDPGSPLYSKEGEALDPGAVSIFVSCDPENPKGLDVKYRSESPDAIQRIQNRWRVFRSNRPPAVSGSAPGEIALRFSELPGDVEFNDSLLRYFGVSGPE